MSEKKVEGLLKNLGEKLQNPGALSPGAREFHKLLELAETDKAVSKRLAELSTGSAKEIVAYGKEKGFTFTEKDMLDFGKILVHPTGELSDEELQMAAGGCVFVVMGAVRMATAFASQY